MSELFTKLGIDWHLFLAQVFNFGILAFLLHRFLYKPLLKVLTDRSAMAKEIVENAASMAEAKKNLDKESEEIKLTAKKEADIVLTEARKKAEAMHAEAIVQLEKDLVTLKNKASADIEKEKVRVMAGAKAELAETVILAAEKVLAREVKTADSMRLAKEALEKVKD